MTIKIHTLAVTGPGKQPALLEFKGKSHLVFGPTDTGKSYIVECLRYCLGSDSRPKGVGYSDGYTLVALQVARIDGDKYTFFRDLLNGEERVYSGFHIYTPQDGTLPIDKCVSELLAEWNGGIDKKVLIKSGKLGNFTAGDLRRVSIFDEIETLDNVPFEGNDTNLKTRNRSSLALILTGHDDSNMLLPPSTDSRNIAKGHVDALYEEIENLMADLPEGMTKLDAEEGLNKISKEIESINQYLKTHEAELTQLKESRLVFDADSQKLSQRISALSEAQNSFKLLDEKYSSDLQRLQAMSTAAAVLSNFELRACPLCLTDIKHQARHDKHDEQNSLLRQAAFAEVEKIIGLREGLRESLIDLLDDIDENKHLLNIVGEKLQENMLQQQALLSPKNSSIQNGLVLMTERKSELAVALSNLNRLDRIHSRIGVMKAKTKRKKQVVERDLSGSAIELCKRIKNLLEIWGVPGVDGVYFDDSVSDININQRKRISFGKGKRGIFLTAYMVALMEHSLESEFPHMGFTIIDSPVVTYRDPKHATISEDEDLLDDGVKDLFYSWLADRTGNGQVIILENEEPNNRVKTKLEVTEFVGIGAEIENGRQGFFP